MNTRRKKIRKDRLAILLVLCAVVITTIGFGIWKISGMLFHDPYEHTKPMKQKEKITEIYSRSVRNMRTRRLYPLPILHMKKRN